ncbi:MAG TPA: SIS domain-containing protein [Candidatus Eremiobacteraceae bacterium]|nr:SIS domain-containing protein [Candidatus Eremiobacteraceae bacterium]
MTIQNNHISESHTWTEILSQGTVWKTVLQETWNHRVMAEIVRGAIHKREWLFVGCGTSFYLAEAAAVSWTLLTGQAARAIPASEVLLFPKLIAAEGNQLQAVVISRSGRTSEAVRAATVLRRELRITTVGITCADQSDLGRACDWSMVLGAADEQSTVMTRSFTSMLIGLQAIAACTTGNVGFVENLRVMAEAFAPRISGIAAQIEKFVAQHSFADYIFLGQGPFHGIAREAALKVMEMSCSYSQFFHALEFRHGPKAIVSPATCLTFFLSDSAEGPETEVLEEMKELGGIIVTICNRASAEIRRSSDLIIELNLAAAEVVRLAPSIVPCQLLGYFTGLRKGLNPDQPKNLTRVVLLD